MLQPGYISEGIHFEAGLVLQSECISRGIDFEVVVLCSLAAVWLNVFRLLRSGCISQGTYVKYVFRCSPAVFHRGLNSR